MGIMGIIGRHNGHNGYDGQDWPHRIGRKGGGAKFRLSIALNFPGKYVRTSLSSPLK